MLSKSPYAESLICWAASTKNRSYSGFYCTPDLEQKTGLRSPVVSAPKLRPKVPTSRHSPLAQRQQSWPLTILAE